MRLVFKAVWNGLRSTNSGETGIGKRSYLLTSSFKRWNQSRIGNFWD
jgi:hypothetical protein